MRTTPPCSCTASCTSTHRTPWHRVAAGLAAVLLLGALAGCGGKDAPVSATGGSGSGSGSEPGSGSGPVAGSGAGASCAAAIRYGGRLYLIWGGRGWAPEPTGRTLPAVLPGCNDTGPAGPQEPDRAVTVDVLRATDPQVAVGYRGDIYVREGARLPGGPRWMRGTDR